jgi:hypothetical protein
VILDRPIALWLGLAQAVINAAVFLLGVPWTTDQIVVANALAATAIALIGNKAATGTFVGRAPTVGK